MYFSKRNKIVIAFAVVILTSAVITGDSFSRAIFAPGSDPMSAKLAEWARDHGLGVIVTGLENLQYKLNAPKVGGTVSIAVDHSQKQKIGIQDSIPAIATPALPNEGVYQTALIREGQPVIQYAELRPDTIHTSYLATVVWMSGAHTKFQLQPGFQEPGNLKRFNISDLVSSTDQNLLATFNSGFKLQSANGGFYLNGVEAKKLVNGSAALVTFKDGHSDIGVWGRDFQMNPNISSVRENLHLLIDNGVIAPNIGSAVQSNWGATLGSKTYVWRSGIGETKNGDFVYVCGDALSAESLATLLFKAGSVRAMQLDINPAWISYMWYQKTSNGNLKPIKAAAFDRHANRYFQPSSRDFFGVYLK